MEGTDYTNFLVGSFNCTFFHEVEQYLKSKNLIFIVLFIYYNAPGHVQALGVHLFEDEVSAKVHHPSHSADG